MRIEGIFGPFEAYAGFQPKPAVEVIIVAMKPCTERTYTEQAQTNGKGVTWLDDCRIPSNENGIGRFPSNLLVSDCVLGAHSKFFDLDRWAEDNLPFIIVPKASRKEKEAALDEVAGRIMQEDYRTKDQGKQCIEQAEARAPEKYVPYRGIRCSALFRLTNAE